ncbi:MAG: dynamin family protein [Oscillospiraceae bacterium]|nr:dynamin family protein [Oscillospiraceae bacterium]
MATVKIISNPYKKTVCFERYSEDASEWRKIDLESNPNSKLLRKEITGGFFPFHVKQIVETIVEEYGTPEEPVELVFEGSADEYDELQAVCTSGIFEPIIAMKRSCFGLANARDILPEVKGLFQKMSPLILKSVSQNKIQQDLMRFSDASSDVVPICVLGNYSTGKSTFINALIGSELLPSGAEPVTAKVYKIARSKYSDRASIKCKYLVGNIQLTFTNSTTQIVSDIEENDLELELKEALDQMAGEDIISRVNKALFIINDMENRTEAVVISDLIEVEVPFSSGVLANSQHPFVIFDTPGSNSASNIKHLNVLKNAMASMTNGLPIFLSTPDALDSTDNENLYHIISDLEELDSRFTMIVVNKADSTGIQRRPPTELEQKKILSQAVPRNLYSGGLFYVSSILGLGAKTDGVFIDYDYEDIYEAQVARYRDPNHRHYRSLYQNNIMPEQIKHRSDALAASQTDLVYANSGLFSIETEIETFAGKYASYNKCFQSHMFLSRVITITDEEIEKKKQNYEEIQKNIRGKLDRDKRLLLERLESASNSERSFYSEEYPKHMAEYTAMTEGTFSVEELVEQESAFSTVQREKMSIDQHEQALADARDSVGDNLRSNFQQVFRDQRFNLDALKAAAQGFVSDVGTFVDKSRARHDTQKEIDRAVADDLMQYASKVFTEKRLEYFNLLDEQSKIYWTEATERIRTTLATIVAGETVLTDDSRSELEHIIITYKPIAFDDNTTEVIFNKEEYKLRLQIGNIVLWQSDHLNTAKLSDELNRNMAKNVQELFGSIAESHKESARAWIKDLLGEITQNIVKYSPDLFKQQQQIELLSDQIKELLTRKAQLREYSEELSAMMNWIVV